MNELRQWILEHLDRGEAIVLAAVTRASGSTARGTDALLAMDANGAMEGTVGGGLAEHKTITAAQELLGTEQASVKNGARINIDAARGGLSRDLDFDLSPKNNGTSMICGGCLSTHLERIDPKSDADIALRACIEEVEKGTPCAFVVARDETRRDNFAFNARFQSVFPKNTTGGEEFSLRAVLGRACEDGELSFDTAAIVSAASTEIFWLGMVPDPVVYIFGAGHVGKATCEAAHLAGFRVIVTDDRPELLTPERFPHANLLRPIENFDNPLAAYAGPHAAVHAEVPAIELGTGDCALILTRQPDIDKSMLARLLRTKAGYVGLIGSKTKRDGIYAALKSEGFTDADLARVHCPIGLAIGARTPGEIAVSIMAEIIAVRAESQSGKSASS